MTDLRAALLRAQLIDERPASLLPPVQNIVIDKPYVPVPPNRGRVWPVLLGWYVPRLLRKQYGVVKVECVHADRLTTSIRAGHGIVVAPNHCRDEDPLVLGALSRCAGSPFFLLASWHVFMQGRFKRFLLTRAGAFSIYREGIDRAAINTATEMLETAERPLVIFPEGFIARTNDRLNDLMEGVALIARSAAKKRAKMEPPKKVVVHPVGIRYQFHGDINAAATKVLDEIESRLTWRPHRHLPLLDRIYKVGGALLALKELEYLGQPQTGTIAQRIERLIDSILAPLEETWCEGDHGGSVNARVKRLRSAILPDMIKGDIDDAERDRRWKQLADVYLANELSHYPADYVHSNPTPMRILETIERFEEDLTDKIRVHGHIAATITVGEAIEVSPARQERGAGGGDPLLRAVESQLRSMLGLSQPEAMSSAGEKGDATTPVRPISD
jgi:1-acyl-sn-glycerol-3-phosphate acyltransferase